MLSSGQNKVSGEAHHNQITKTKQTGTNADIP
jgi:hypothetical protein